MNCDFCFLPSPQEGYDHDGPRWKWIECKSFVVEVVDSNTKLHTFVNMDKDWLVCPDCAIAFDARDWEKLLKRVRANDPAWTEVAAPAVIQLWKTIVNNLPDGRV